MRNLHEFVYDSDWLLVLEGIFGEKNIYWAKEYK